MTAEHEGRTMLARLIDAIAGSETPTVMTDEMWSDFRTAVAVANTEIRAAELEGVERWRRARHKQ